MRRLVRARRVGSRFDARLLSSAAAILLLTSPSQAAITTMAPAFTAGDGAAVLDASLQPAGNASNVHSSEELIDFAPQMNIDCAEIFDGGPDPIMQPFATADVTRIAWVAAGTRLSSGEAESHFQRSMAFDLAINGLGPTNIAKSGKFSVGGLDFSLLRVFLIIFATVLVVFALVWRKPT